MLDQKDRQARLITPLGENVLFLLRAEVTEGLSELTEVAFDAVSDKDDIDPAELVGRNATLGIALPAGGDRFFNGYITRFGLAGRHERYTLYQGTIRPQLWFLTKSQDCRIFHEKSAKDIVSDILDERGVSDFEFKLSGSPPNYEYCVQYNETDYNFISRLCEREGIYFFFEHENGSHRLVFVDSMSSHRSVEHYDSLELFPDDKAAGMRREGLRSWSTAYEVRSTRVSLEDYDYTKPRAEIDAESSTSRDYGDLEVYVYPGGYYDKGRGDYFAQVRVEALQAGGDRAEADGTYRGVAVGAKFDLVNHKVGRFNGSYLVSKATHRIEGGQFESGGGGSGDIFSTRFEAIPTAETYRPPLKTPRPFIVGPQTAVVVGSGEIDADEYGSVLVRFNWERDGEDSCRVRVSQAWAGNGWGAMVVPRIGQEVIVEFLDGDPDRPIITGRVYNAASMPAYNPKDKPATTTIKSNSHPGGAGANELRFDDDAGKERIVLNAQKDWETWVGETRVTTIGTDDHLAVGQNRHVSVSQNSHHDVGANEHLKVGTTLHTTVGAMMLTDVGANMITNVAAALKLKSNMMQLESQHIELKAPVITLSGQAIYIGGGMVFINSGSMPCPVPVQKPQKPEKPKQVEETGYGKIGEKVKDGKRRLRRLDKDDQSLSEREKKSRAENAALARRMQKAAKLGDAVIMPLDAAGLDGGGASAPSDGGVGGAGGVPAGYAASSPFEPEPAPPSAGYLETDFEEETGEEEENIPAGYETSELEEDTAAPTPYKVSAGDDAAPDPYKEALTPLGPSDAEEPKDKKPLAGYSDEPWDE